MHDRDIRLQLYYSVKERNPGSQSEIFTPDISKNEIRIYLLHVPKLTWQKLAAPQKSTPVPQ